MHKVKKAKLIGNTFYAWVFNIERTGINYSTARTTILILGKTVILRDFSEGIVI